MRALFLSVVALFLALPAMGHDSRFPSVWVDDLLIHTPIIRPAPPGAPVAAGYLGIANTGDTDDILLSATTDMAAEVQLHEMAMSGDVMKMRPVEGGIPIPAGETVWLKPGGLHLMLMKPGGDVSEGKKFFVTLEFESDGTAKVPFTVAPMDAIQNIGNENFHSHDD